jgi:predicted transcriptional regulator
MVAPETKGEWKDAVEDSTEYSSLSDLVRRAVTKELSETESPQPAGEASVDSGTLEELTDGLKRIESKIEDIDSRVSSIEGSTGKSDAALTKNKIFTSLNGSDEAKTPARIADEIGFSEEKVANQLEKLESQTGLLEMFVSEEDGKPRYYTENN